MDLEKFRCFFQISKNHNSVNFCRRQNSYLKKSFGVSFSIGKKIKKPKNRKKKFLILDLEKFRCFFKLQKIITRKISILGKNFTFKKMLRISFSIRKKNKKGGVQNRREGGGACK